MSSSRHEIQERLRKRFLDRLSVRMRRLRRELIERNWPVLKAECRSIGGTGTTFGFERLSNLATKVDQLIPDGDVSRAQTIPDARHAVEELIVAIDSVLSEHQISGPQS